MEDRPDLPPRPGLLRNQLRQPRVTAMRPRWHPTPAGAEKVAGTALPPLDATVRPRTRGTAVWRFRTWMSQPGLEPAWHRGPRGSTAPRNTLPDSQAGSRKTEFAPLLTTGKCHWMGPATGPQ